MAVPTSALNTDLPSSNRYPGITTYTSSPPKSQESNDGGFQGASVSFSAWLSFSSPHVTFPLPFLSPSPLTLYVPLLSPLISHYLSLSQPLFFVISLPFLFLFHISLCQTLSFSLTFSLSPTLCHFLSNLLFLFHFQSLFPSLFLSPLFLFPSYSCPPFSVSISILCSVLSCPLLTQQFIHVVLFDNELSFYAHNAMFTLCLTFLFLSFDLDLYVHNVYTVGFAPFKCLLHQEWHY